MLVDYNNSIEGFNFYFGDSGILTKKGNLTKKFYKLYNEEVDRVNKEIEDHNNYIDEKNEPCHWMGKCSDINEKRNHDCYGCDRN